MDIDPYHSRYFDQLYDAYLYLGDPKSKAASGKPLVSVDSLIDSLCESINRGDLPAIDSPLIEELFRNIPLKAPLKPDSSPGEAVFEAMRYAAAAQISPPQWATDFIANGWSRFRGLEVKSLEAAYGVAPHNNRKVRTNRRDPGLDLALESKFDELRRAGKSHGEALDDLSKLHNVSDKVVERAVTAVRKFKRARKKVLHDEPDLLLPD